MNEDTIKFLIKPGNILNWLIILVVLPYVFIPLSSHEIVATMVNCYSCRFLILTGCPYENSQKECTHNR